MKLADNFIRELNITKYTNERQTNPNAGIEPWPTQPDYKSFSFINNSHETKIVNECKSTNLELNRQKAGIVRNLAGVKYFLFQENLVHRGAFPTTPGDSEGSKGKRKIHTKKTMANSRMPEMVAFLQDSNCDHFVKDVFLDGQMRCKNGCLVENRELDHNSISSILNSDVDCSTESTKETLDMDLSTSNESKIFAEDGDAISKYGSRKFILEAEQVFDGLDEDSSDHCGEKIVQGLLPGREMLCKRNAEAELSNSMVFPTAEEVDCCRLISESSYKSELETTTIATEASMQAAEHEQTSEVGFTSRREDLCNGHDQGEYNFFAGDDPLLGPMECLGPIYCGSISLRSTCSTTSSRSFAFPTLASEWNGSPVRMANTDRKQMQRHQRWRMRFLCCKF